MEPDSGLVESVETVGAKTETMQEENQEVLRGTHNPDPGLNQVGGASENLDSGAGKDKDVGGADGNLENGPDAEKKLTGTSLNLGKGSDDKDLGEANGNLENGLGARKKLVEAIFSQSIRLDNDKQVGGMGPDNDKEVGTENGNLESRSNDDKALGMKTLDEVLGWADQRRSYERILVWGFVVPVCLWMPCCYLNVLLMIYLPTTQCTLPPPPPYFSHDAWRSFITPRDPSGQFSSCQLYDYPTALRLTPHDLDLSHRRYSPVHPTPSQKYSPQEIDPQKYGHQNFDPQNISPENVDPKELNRQKRNTQNYPWKFEPQKDALRENGSRENDPLLNTTKYDPEEDEHGQKSEKKTAKKTTGHDYSSQKDVPQETELIREEPILTSTKYNPGEEVHMQEMKRKTVDEKHAPQNDANQDYTPRRDATQESGSGESDPLLNTTMSDPREDDHTQLEKTADQGHEPQMHNQSRKETPMESYIRAALAWQDLHPGSLPKNYTTGCIFGYDIDRTYVTETMATEFKWVCGDATPIQHVLHAAMLGNLFGCIIFGALADRFGRRLVFVLIAVEGAILGAVFVYVRRHGILLIVRFMVSLGIPAMYHIVIITALEQVDESRRGLVTCLSSVCYSLGQCLLALLAWGTATWRHLGLLTSLPALLAPLYLCFVEESPRWLLARGRVEEAGRVVERVARRNHSTPPSLTAITTTLRKVSQPQNTGRRGGCRRAKGIFKFVAKYPKLSFRMALVTVCWTVTLMTYFTSTMRYPYVLSNPYLGWFCSTVMEIPANLLLPVLLPRCGRRILHAGVMGLCSLSLLVPAVVMAAGYDTMQQGAAWGALGGKFCTSLTFLIVYLQAAELHPTPVRSVATGLASLVAFSVNVFSPALLALEPAWKSYLVLGIIAAIGSLCAALLPETSGKPLPQTLMQAENFSRRRSRSRGRSSRREEGRRRSSNEGERRRRSSRKEEGEKERRKPEEEEEMMEIQDGEQEKEEGCREMPAGDIC